MSEVDYGQFAQASHYHEGRISPIRLVVVHATAGQESSKGTGAEAVMHMFADPNSRVASAHVTCDQDSIARSVHDKDTAFGAAHANSCGLHIEQVGMPDQTTQQWMDDISKKTILNTARVVRDWCNSYGLTKQILTVDQVKSIVHGTNSTLTGITFHADVESAWPSTGHTDPGPHYPRSWFLDQVKQGVTPKPAPLVSNPYPQPHITQDHATFLHVGSTGTGVKFVQWALGIKDDGNFGAQTAASLNAWKKKVGFTADGIVGPGTLTALASIKHHAS